MKNGDKLYKYCVNCEQVTSHTMSGGSPCCDNC